MRVVVDWLNDHLDQKLAPGQVVSALENAGVEVEEVIEPTVLDDRIITSKIVDIKPHPDADKLQVVTVDTGREELEIVCGASNIETGQIVPLAKDGARLPDGTVVKAAAIRGQSSAGMLLSPKELGVGEDHSGLLILGGDTKPGRGLHELYSHAQTVLDIKTAANRPDLQSVIGLAREVAVHSQAGLKVSELDRFERVTVSNSRSKQLFTIGAKDAVPRYSAAKINLNSGIGPAPDWIKQRLLLSGVRPVNLVVDITNYVMLEVGQPLHAFDAHKLHGKLQVRAAARGETLKTLDGVERSLSPRDLVIADARGPVALAGVMGGEATEISTDTKTLLVETATFDGTTVRKTGVRHGLRTESSSRFERGLPVQYVAGGLERFIELIAAESKVEVELVEDEINSEPRPVTVAVTAERFTQLAKVDITADTIEKSLPQLGFRLQPGAAKAGGQIKVAVPYWRPDVNLEEDVFEEVIKVVGLDQVPATLPSWQPEQVMADSFWPRYWRLRNILAGLGLFEVTTYPFVSIEQLEQLSFNPSDHLKLQNPRSEEQAYLRRSLLPPMLGSVANNSRRAESFGLFEMAKVYLPSDEQLPQEPIKVGVIVQSPANVYKCVKNVFDQLTRVVRCDYELKPSLKRSFAHLGRQVDVFVDDKSSGYLVELHPLVTEALKIKQRVAYLELDLSQLLAGWQAPIARPLPRFQPALRDVTVLVGRHTPWLDIKQSITDSALAEPQYKGDYYGEDIDSDKRALTIGLKIYGRNQTLTDMEANRRVDEILKVLDKNFGTKLKDS